MAEVFDLHGSDSTEAPNRRVLIIDDNPRIHDDFRTILVRESQGLDLLLDLEAELFGDVAQKKAPEVSFLVDSAYQGQEGLEKVQTALKEGHPYAVAFVDVRMPPGWDGVETIQHLWKADPNLLVVICTAYSDYTWEETVDILEPNIDFLVLKKPFDSVVVRQLATSLTEHWSRMRRDQVALDQLRVEVAERDRDLDRARALLQQEREARQRVEQVLRRAWELDGERTEEGDVSALLQRYDELRGRDEGEDLDALLASLPPAMDRTLQGVQRLSSTLADRDQGATFRADLAVAQAVSDAVDHYRGVAEVRCDYASASEIPGRASDLVRVLFELIVNACQAMQRAGRHGEIRVRTEDTADQVHIQVCDDGPGIPAALRETLFEPLVGTHGDGQGLAVARDLIQSRLGGRITVEHPASGGAAFHLHLPRGSSR